MKIHMKCDNHHTGMLFVQSGNAFFPFDDWDDLYVNILSMWLFSLNQYENDSYAVFEMPFMDGPYTLRCKKREDILTVMGIDEHTETGVVKFEETMSYMHMKNLVLACAKNLLDAFPAYQETDKDMMELHQEFRNSTGNGSLCHLMPPNKLQ